jgi:hypothetical protein
VRATGRGSAQESRKKGSQVLGVKPHDSGERKERFSNVIRS